jgi:hypothetical protein
MQGALAREIANLLSDQEDLISNRNLEPLRPDVLPPRRRFFQIARP